MSLLKSLAKDTALYGLSSMVGRFLNYLLVPLYTAVMPATTGEYGVVNHMYGYVALVLVVLTCGMETTFLRWAGKEGQDVRRLYSTALMVVGTLSALFLAACFACLGPLSAALGYGAHPEFIAMMAVVVALDAVSNVPFVYLRYQKRALRFAVLKLTNILINIGLNLFVFLLCPRIHAVHPEWIAWFYESDYLAGYVFAINLVTSLATLVLLWPEVRQFRWGFDGALVRSMLRYSYPIVLLGLAGVVNQAADKILVPMLIPGREGLVQLGIYNAAAKIAMIMAMATQAFRYAYEPIVFGRSREGGRTPEQVNVVGTRYFVLFTLLGFLAVMAWIDPIKVLLIRNEDYWEGLRVVPIVMLAEILMGIYFNFSFWYKLTDETLWGALFSFVGCAVLVAVYVFFVPTYGYMACAWAGVAGYGTCMLLSYAVGQRRHPIPYDVRSMLAYAAVAATLYGLMLLVPAGWGTVAGTAAKTAIVGVYAAIIYLKEKHSSRGQLSR